jgi:glycine hydroxymethyltransferase
VLAGSLLAEGMRLVTGGTDNHLLVLDSVASVGMDGAHAEHILERAGITSNKQLIPDDPQPPLRPSGLRLGTPAVTTRGMGQPELRQIGAWVAEALRHGVDEARLDSIRRGVEALCRMFPIPNRML